LAEEIAKKKWKSSILRIATEEGIKEPNDWGKFNSWMMKGSIFKKSLNEHSLDELKALHRQMHKLRSNNEKSAQVPLTRAWLRKGNKNKALN